MFLLKVRFAALKVLESFHARLGEDFMVLLPETIPFLAELMEGEIDVEFFSNFFQRSNAFMWFTRIFHFSSIQFLYF